MRCCAQAADICENATLNAQVSSRRCGQSQRRHNPDDEVSESLGCSLSPSLVGSTVRDAIASLCALLLCALSTAPAVADDIRYFSCRADNDDRESLVAVDATTRKVCDHEFARGWMAPMVFDTTTIAWGDGALVAARTVTDAPDGRVALTVRGREDYQRLVRQREDDLSKMLADWRPEEHPEVVHMMRELARSFASSPPLRP